MPSLNALREFKDSFDDIGGQKADLAAKGIPHERIKLPDFEPEPLPSKTEYEEPIQETEGIQTEPPERTADPGFSASPLDDLDFSAFLGAQPGDLPVPPADNFIPEEPPVERKIGGEPRNAEDFYFPEELLPDEDFAAGDTAAEDNNSFEASNLDDFGLPSAPDSSKSADFDNPDDFGSFDEPVAMADDDPFEAGNLSDFGPLDEPAAADGGDSSFDLDSLDNFGLPDEPATADGSDSFDLDNFDSFGLPDESTTAADGSDSFDLDNFDSFGLPDESTPAESGDSLDLDSLDSFGLPDEPPAADGDDSSLDLDSLDSFGLPDEPAAADGGDSLDLDSFDGFGLPDEPAAAADGGDSFDLDSLDGFGLPDEPAAADGGDSLDLDSLDGFGLPDEPAAAADGGDSLDLDSLDGFGLPDEPPAADGDDSLDLDSLDGFGLPDESAAVEGGETNDLFSNFDPSVSIESTAVDGGDSINTSNLKDFGGFGESDGIGGETADDLFSNFDPGVSVEPSSGPQSVSGDNVFDDFSFPGLDNILDDSRKAKSAATPPTGRTLFGLGRKSKAQETTPGNVDEIKISDTELGYLQETLSAYPLNLRIACEEIIAEQFVSPEQMARLIRSLIRGAPAREAASLASEILDRPIPIPKGFEKSSGEALETEQGSFAYIFVHKFLPVLRLFSIVAVITASLFYLVYKFAYIPLKAESIYKIGYERIFAGELQRANERFSEAFAIHRKKDWFYKYAEAFRDEKKYTYAEQKYEELLRYYPRDKKGILDYAKLETNSQNNYAKADSILRQRLLDFSPNDPDGLLAAGDNCLLWGEVDPSKYDDARYYYARLLELYGRMPLVVERMLMYFIRTDNLKEVLLLKNWFEEDLKKRPLMAETMAELGGYLLDKQLEEAKGVPNEYVGQIEGVRDILLKAVSTEPSPPETSLPEAHYHLARYYKSLGNEHEERITLEDAIRAFGDIKKESVRRLEYHIDAHQRLSDNLIAAREFIPAEERLVKGIEIFDDAVSRRLMSRSPKYGRLYAGLGDLAYFTKAGDMEAALEHYRKAEQNGWSPPEMLYRMGSAYYQQENWKNALEYLFTASSGLPLNRRILFALGNAAIKRGDYFAAQGYYSRLLDILETQRTRLPVLLPNDRPEYLELAERLMMARNNAGVAYEMLAAQTGDISYQTRALASYTEAASAWDARTRDPRSMVRSASTPLPYLNSRNMLYPQVNYEPQIFIRIDREALETSIWEEIAPFARTD